MALLLETHWGDLVIDLDDAASPELRLNFLKLAKARFYTKTLIFSVTPNRFCQLGDPVGDGTGGTSIYGLLDDDTAHYRTSSRRFLASTCGRPVSQTDLERKGLVVATCSGNIPNTIGSQFLITIAGGPNNALDGYINISHHSAAGGAAAAATADQSSLFVVLGQVVEDENNVLDKINAAFLDTEGRPYADIRIIRALPVYDPYDDPPGLAGYMAAHGVLVEDGDGDTNDQKTAAITRTIIRSPSPDRPEEEAVPKRISAADVEVEDLDNDETLQRRLEEEQEETEKRHDQSRAVVLEMLGDLPDADIRAPEDVLFLCKLNPVTVDEDLELIFSRFDESVKVEIIRDPDTGASLQYAFAEFSNKRAAEEAYFKMNNALIDDRRIKVDFSQSVAKLWDKYHQRMRMPKPNRADGSFVHHQQRIQQNQGKSSINRLPGDGKAISSRRREDNRYNDHSRREKDDVLRSRSYDRRSVSYDGRKDDIHAKRRWGPSANTDHRSHHRHDEASHDERRRGHSEERKPKRRRHSEERDRKARRRYDSEDSSSRTSSSESHRHRKQRKKSDRTKHKKSKKGKYRKHRRSRSSSSSR